MGRGRNGERPGLADRLVAERKRRGLRQIDAAREIGIRRRTLALVEILHIPSRATRDRIARGAAAGRGPDPAQACDRRPA